MKTIVASIKNPAAGDLIILEYSEIRNGQPVGCTSVKHRVCGPSQRQIFDDNGVGIGFEPIPGDSARDIAQHFAIEINGDWMKEAFSARVKDGDDKLIIGCTDLVSHKIAFKASVAGDGGTTVEVEEF